MRQQTRQTQKADAIPRFERNVFYEQLLKMQRENPRTFETLSMATRLALNSYTVAKRQHELLNEEAGEQLPPAA